MRTKLEQYLKVTVEMLLARLAEKDESGFLAELDALWLELSTEEIEFVDSFR